MDLQINNLCFQYEKNNLIFENINLQANMGDIISIQGYNGSGKTTFLKLLAGLLTPSKGTIMYKDIYVDPKSYKKIMAYIPTELYTFDMLTGIEHAYLCVDLWDMREHKNDYVDYFYMLCDKLHTSEHLEKRLCDCSYGTKYKIYLATMFARRPKLIYMDEPFNSMDEPSRSFIIQYLKSISKNVIIIYTSHQQDTINQLSNYKYIIDNKKITMKGEEL